MVTAERRGQWIFYRLDPSVAERLGTLARSLVPGALIPVGELLSARATANKGSTAATRAEA